MGPTVRCLGWLGACLLAAALCVGCAELQRAGVLEGFVGPGAGALDEPTVAAGLKEALRVATERAVAATSALDGFWGDARIRIALPQELEKAAGALRAVGLGGQVDAFEVTMNRAAEKAAGEAREVFWDAVAGMTLGDAFAILRGGETAATDYFRAHTSETLEARFRPVVAEKMAEVGLYRVYDAMLSGYQALPFAAPPPLDLDGYVTGKALDGLYQVLSREEARIRRDPAARSTQLLRRVFAGGGSL